MYIGTWKVFVQKLIPFMKRYNFCCFRKLFEEGDDKGSSLSVYHKGKAVLDLRGGFANEKELWPWQENTTTRLFSTTKGLGALAIGVLVDR